MASPAIMSPMDGPEGQLGAALPLHETPAVATFYRVLTAVAAWLLVGVLVFIPNMKIIGYPMTMYLCIGIIIFCAKVRGAKVFGRTPVDFAFVLWLGLA